MSKKDKESKLNFVFVGVVVALLLSIASIIFFTKDIGYEFGEGTIYELQVKSEISAQSIEELARSIQSRSNIQEMEENYYRVYLNDHLDRNSVEEKFNEFKAEDSESRIYHTQAVFDSHLVRNALVVTILSFVFIAVVFTFYKSPVVRKDRLAFFKALFVKTLIISIILTGVAFLLNGIKLIDFGFTGVELIISLVISYLLMQIVMYVDYTQNYETLLGDSSAEKLKTYFDQNQKVVLVITVSLGILISSVFVFTESFIMLLSSLVIVWILWQVIDMYLIKGSVFNFYTQFVKKFSFINKSKFWNKSS